jgi:hypothetical protein
MLDVFRLHPSEFNKSLDDLVMFIAQVRTLLFSVCVTNISEDETKGLCLYQQVRLSVVELKLKVVPLLYLKFAVNYNVILPFLYGCECDLLP